MSVWLRPVVKKPTSLAMGCSEHALRQAANQARLCHMRPRDHQFIPRRVEQGACGTLIPAAKGSAARPAMITGKNHLWLQDSRRGTGHCENRARDCVIGIALYRTEHPGIGPAPIRIWILIFCQNLLIYCSPLSAPANCWNTSLPNGWLPGGMLVTRVGCK